MKNQNIIICIISILVMVFITCEVYSQVYEYRPVKELQWRALTGEVYFIPFFIDTPSGEFEDEEVEYYLSELNKSKMWILEQSKQYPDVNLEIVDDYVDSADEIVYLDNVNNWNQGRNNNIPDDISNYLNYDSIEDYVSYQGIDIERSKVVILCFVKQNGRSHAYDINNSVFSKDISIDHAIVFCNSKFGTYTTNKVITHEILHLFRAWDLYGGEPQNDKKAKKLKEMFPNSIMINTRGSAVPILDEITAWRIGWNFEPKSSYAEYKPEYRKNMKEMKKKKGKSYSIPFGSKESVKENK